MDAGRRALLCGPLPLPNNGPHGACLNSSASRWLFVQVRVAYLWHPPADTDMEGGESEQGSEYEDVEVDVDEEDTEIVDPEPEYEDILIEE